MLFLVLLVAPFWISYLMRMYAWQSLLTEDGYVNKLGTFLHILAAPVNWQEGRAITVILGLVYGYIPYMILPLYAGLDRIDSAMLEAGRDLGASPTKTFRARDAAAQPPGHPGRPRDRRPPHVRRLLHQQHALELARRRR